MKDDKVFSFQFSVLAIALLKTENLKLKASRPNAVGGAL